MATEPEPSLARRLGFHFRPLTTSQQLALAIGALALAAMTAIALSAVSLLREQAEEHALAEVRLAAVKARDGIRRESEDALTSARLLAGRPTLSRLVGQARPDGLQPFLKRFCDTGGLDGCAVLVRDRVLAETSTRAMPWAQLLAVSAEQGERFMVALPSVPDGLLGATVAVPGYLDTQVMVLKAFDAEFAGRLRQEEGVEVRLVRFTNWLDAVDPRTRALHSAALARGEAEARRIDGLRAFAASVPVFASTGEGVALIESRLPTIGTESAMQQLVRRIVLVALSVGAVAVLLGVLLGRRFARPLRDLTRAARRVGQGDFATSIPVSGGVEARTLAHTMERMRDNLVDLTTALRRREAEAQALLQGVVEGVFAVDERRQIRYLNPQAARMLGVAVEDALGRFCGDVLRPACGADGARPCETDCPILLAHSTGRAQRTEQLERADGSRRTVIITSAEAVDGLQVQIMRDETELEAVRRARDSILANISHEFRTPLAAQIASIELLHDGLESMSREQLGELVNSLQRGALRLTRLIDNLLESVRIESGQLAIRRQPVSLAQVVEDAEQLVEGLIAQREQTLEVAVPGDLPSVPGDAPRLTQVLVNLLANANKFGPDGSTIRVGAAVDEGTVELWVDDEGPGVPDGERGSIFERFQRGADVDPEPRGLGLGLWIARSIVERHGGDIAATRSRDGRNRLRVRLPVEVVV